MADTASEFGRYRLSGYRAALLRGAQAMPANWPGRRGALVCRKLALKGWNAAGPAVIDAVVEGLKFRLYMQDNVSERKFLFLPQFFDRAERDLLRQELPPGATFVDVGANAGIYTLTAAAAVGAAGRVLSIEPNPVMIERLNFNVALNGFQDRVTAAALGVSDAVGSFDLVLDDSNLGGSSLVAAGPGKRITVACDLLENILRRHDISRVDALKIDIEGAEDKALAPFFARAPESLHPRLVIIEDSVARWRVDLPALFRAKGYALLRETRMNLVWRRQ